MAAEKWKAKSAAIGSAVTEALVEYSRPLPDMRVLDLASGTGEPGISLAQRVGPRGSVTAVDQSAELLEIAAERARNKNLSTSPPSRPTRTTCHLPTRASIWRPAALE